MALAALIAACAAFAGVLGLAFVALAHHQRQAEIERLYAALTALPLQWENVQQQLRALAGRIDKRHGLLLRSADGRDGAAAEPANASPATVAAPPETVPPQPPQVFSRHDLLARLNTLRGGANGTA